VSATPGFAAGCAGLAIAERFPWSVFEQRENIDWDNGQATCARRSRNDVDRGSAYRVSPLKAARSPEAATRDGCSPDQRSDTRGPASRFAHAGYEAARGVGKRATQALERDDFRFARFC